MKIRIPNKVSVTKKADRVNAVYSMYLVNEGLLMLVFLSLQSEQ